MIDQLTLTNVRRHAHTHIDFSGEGQLISLSGLNGAGKSTVLEGILYALYGETRHGRNGIAAMVRRGAEHEGMEVALQFTLDNVTYNVTRRYEKGKSTASLKANDVEVMRSVGSVTAEITRVFGMDSTGFKLATIAKQKELDGLAELTPAKRRAAVARLLRLDAITQASREAREEYTRAKDLSLALAAQSDLGAATAAVTEAENLESETKKALDDQREIVAELNSQMRSVQNVGEQWEAKQLLLSAALARVSACSDTITNIQSQIDGVVIPAHPGEFTPSAAYVLELVGLTKMVSDAEEAERVRSTRERISRDVARDSKELEKLESLAQTKNEVAKLNSEATTVLKETTLKLNEHRQLVSALEVSYRLQVAKAGDLLTRVSKLGELGAECQTCEQEISEEHKHSQKESAVEEHDVEQAKAEELATQLADSQAECAQLSDDLGVATGSFNAAESMYREVVQAQNDCNRLTKSVETNKQTLERLPNTELDLEDLWAKKAILESDRAQSVAFEETVSVIDNAQRVVKALSVSLDQANQALTAAQVEVTQAEPSAELTSDYEKLGTLKMTLEPENAILNACSERAQEASGAVRVAKSSQMAAKALGEEAEKAQSEALVASKSAEVLTLMAKTLSTELRPALQAEVSNLLNKLSEGRFSGVEVDEDYGITIKDTDGKAHPVSEFSGGESDLIALAIRLALAQIVAKRNGAQASGFLILDEVLGSQDANRRQSILDGLRTLRSTYGQILLISHVGGLEDASDRVINIEDVEGVATAI